MINKEKEEVLSHEELLDMLYYNPLFAAYAKAATELKGEWAQTS